ncbi:MAG: DUF4058 family protein [Fimbriiglobus sp.]
MPSPFPGMDPYLEDPDLWPDVHGTLLPLIREAIRPALPAGYTARIDQYVWLHADDGDQVRGGRPDVLVSGGGAVPVSEITPFTRPTEQVTLAPMRKRRGNRFIELVDNRRRKVVTVIELLSYANKDPGDDRERYLAKRMEYVAGGTNVVEIDLLRAGSRMPIGRPKVAVGDYYVLVTRAADYPTADLWAFTVQDAIPVFPVPLRPEHGVVSLNLRPCLDHAYDSAGYAADIDYTRPTIPALRPADAAWAADLLKKHARKRK